MTHTYILIITIIEIYVKKR